MQYTGLIIGGLGDGKTLESDDKTIKLPIEEGSFDLFHHVKIYGRGFWVETKITTNKAIIYQNILDKLIERYRSEA